MSKQTKAIRKQCQDRSQCFRDATIGAYAWVQGDTDVNLDKPLRVFCGQHKPRLSPGLLIRNVRLRR